MNKTKKAIIISGVASLGLLGVVFVTKAQISSSLSADTTTLVQNPDGSSAIQVTPAPVSESSFTLSLSQVQEEIQRYTKSIQIDEQKQAADQAQLDRYEGYLSQFPVQTPPTP